MHIGTHTFALCVRELGDADVEDVCHPTFKSPLPLSTLISYWGSLLCVSSWWVGNSQGHHFPLPASMKADRGQILFSVLLKSLGTSTRLTLGLEDAGS